MSDTFGKFYEELWNLDQSQGGFSASARSSSGGWEDINADILLDEQYEAAGKNKDRAPNPLFYRVNEAKLETETYRTFIELLNNYIIDPKGGEDATGADPEEDREREAFLDSIMETKVAEKALEFINSNIGEEVLDKVLAFTYGQTGGSHTHSSLSKLDFKKYIEKVWFELYTNNFDHPQPFCTGFEHVFVGEGKSQGGGIGGYHNWIKFYLDEKGRRVDFTGYNYDNKGTNTPVEKEGRKNPYVTTLQMTWTPKDIYGKPMKRMFKDQGGFFVGISPECQIMMGTLLLLESMSQGFSGTNRNTQINGQIYDLVLYRESPSPGMPNEGMRIRSFYPKYIKPTQVSHGEDHFEIITNDSDIKVAAAYLNPANPDRGRGWVEIDNTSRKKISIAGWRLIDKEGDEKILEGNIGANKTRRLMIYDTDFALGPEGLLELKDRRGKTQFKIKYSHVSVGEILYFDKE